MKERKRYLVLNTVTHLSAYAEDVMCHVALCAYSANEINQRISISCDFIKMNYRRYVHKALVMYITSTGI